MNYFAHARLAATRSDDPRFALGAMLPDWLAWIGDRPRRVADGAVAAGIRFHHECDAAFHAAPRFLTLVRAAGTALADGGLPRGPARGAAHVGVELLLDAALVDLDPEAPFYGAALDAASAASRSITWSRPDSGARFAHAIRRLAAEGPPRRYRDPERLAHAVERTLARRPRLRVPAEARSVVSAWAHAARPDVQRAAPILLAETRDGLRRRARESAGSPVSPRRPGGASPGTSASPPGRPGAGRRSPSPRWRTRRPSADRGRSGRSRPACRGPC